MRHLSPKIGGDNEQVLLDMAFRPSRARTGSDLKGRLRIRTFPEAVLLALLARP
jgi:hypothetical protein